MQPYTGFASVYNIFMDSIPYDEWADFAEGILKKYNIINGLVLELGCGTGSMTARLTDRGYDMIGIDLSEEMLSIAREKSSGRDDKILYLCQDMREFELYGTVAAVFCFCDSMNYMLTEEDLLKVFRLVNNYLDPGGLFLFDMDTPYAFEKVMGDTTLVENRQEGTFIWENTFYPEEMINEVNLTLFLPTIDTKAGDQDFEDMNYNDEEETLYGKYEETHVRRAYSIDMMKQLIEKAGMEWVTAYDAETKGKPKNSSERIYILAREKHQEGKTYL